MAINHRKYKLIGDKVSEGLLRVQTSEGYFHIDPQTGEPAYSERFDFVGHFREGLACVSLGFNDWFHITPDGKPAYKNRFEIVGNFGPEGLARVRKHGRCFHIRRNGLPAYKERYDDVCPFKNGKAKVFPIRKNKPFLIDANGDFVD